VLETAIPQSVLTELTDPAKASSIASDIADGSTPGWYASLPGDVKSYLSSYTAGAVTTSIASAASTAASQATATGSSGSSASTGGAPRATGIVAAGIAGAVGVLGLAIAL